MFILSTSEGVLAWTVNPKGCLPRLSDSLAWHCDAQPALESTLMPPTQSWNDLNELWHWSICIVRVLSPASSRVIWVAMHAWFCCIVLSWSNIIALSTCRNLLTSENLFHVLRRAAEGDQHLIHEYLLPKILRVCLHTSMLLYWVRTVTFHNHRRTRPHWTWETSTKRRVFFDCLCFSRCIHRIVHIVVGICDLCVAYSIPT